MLCEWRLYIFNGMESFSSNRLTHETRPHRDLMFKPIEFDAELRKYIRESDLAFIKIECEIFGMWKFGCHVKLV